MSIMTETSTGSNDFAPVASSSLAWMCKTQRYCKVDNADLEQVLYG